MFCCFLGLVSRQPPPTNPFRNLRLLSILGHTPSTAGTFQKKFQKNSGKTPETLSERFLEFPSRVRLGCAKPYNSRHLRLPEHFQNSLPPSTAGDASLFRSGSGEGLSEPVMEFPAVLGASLTFESLRIFGVRGGALKLLYGDCQPRPIRTKDLPHQVVFFRGVVCELSDLRS